MNSERGVKVSGESAQYSKIFDWYKEDFGGDAGVAVGAEMADIAMVTRGANAEERAAFPGKVFSEVPIGIQALAIIVPRDVLRPVCVRSPKRR